MEWSRVISGSDPVVPISALSLKRSAGAHEHEISEKMVKKIYVDKKKEIGQAVIKSSEMTRHAFMNVITYDGGWLDISSDCNVFSSQIYGTELKKRNEELNNLRRKYIPNVIFLLVKILDNTASWINQFVKDIENKFGNKESHSILSQIYGGDVFEEVNNKNRTNIPFLPETWSRMILLLSKTVALKENHLTQCFDKERMRTLMSFMKDAATNMLCVQ